MTSYQLAHHFAGPHGVGAAVHIPDSPEPVPEHILATLPEPESAHARTLRGYRQVQFVGGRIALRAACEQIGVRPQPVLSDARGAPCCPAGLVGSVSHKRDLAIGMVARADGWTLGVDLEDYGPPRLRIIDHVLRPEEHHAIRALPDDQKWIATVLSFSLKESVYKALDPYVHRYVGFHEAHVATDLEGNAEVTLHLKHNEGPFEVSARYHWLWGRILTSVRIRHQSTSNS